MSVESTSIYGSSSIHFCMSFSFSPFGLIHLSSHTEHEKYKNISMLLHSPSLYNIATLFLALKSTSPLPPCRHCCCLVYSFLVDDGNGKSLCILLFYGVRKKYKFPSHSQHYQEHSLIKDFSWSERVNWKCETSENTRGMSKMFIKFTCHTKNVVYIYTTAVTKWITQWKSLEL